jgi:hypothetical protein
MAENIFYLLLYIVGGLTGIFLILAFAMDFFPDLLNTLKTPDRSLKWGGLTLGLFFLVAIGVRTFLVLF